MGFADLPTLAEAPRRVTQKSQLPTRKRLKGRKQRDEAKVKTCGHCGKLFEHREKRRPGLACSRACYDALRAFKPYDGPCVVCGERCEPKTASGRWRIRTARTKTCSKICAFRREAADAKPRKCKQCKARFFPNQRLLVYCSRKCYDAKLAEQGWVIAPCDECGSSVRRRRQWARRGKRALVFCGRECTVKHFTGAKSPSWRGGASLKRGTGWERIAESIRVRDGFRCRRCGKTQEENGQRLSVDHVRPWRDRESEEQANHPSNLVSLCRPCHARKATLERRWLRGDGVALQEYRKSVGIAE